MIIINGVRCTRIAMRLTMNVYVRIVLYMGYDIAIARYFVAVACEASSGESKTMFLFTRIFTPSATSTST